MLHTATALLSEIIEHSAERFGERDAFRFQGQAITYAELLSRSNRLAQALLDRGLNRQDRVGIYLNKSLETAVAIYGILRAGGAYVPIDPTAPSTRIAFILKDCGIRHLITQPDKRKVLEQIAQDETELWVFGSSPDKNAPWFGVSWQEVATYSDASPSISTQPEHLAYIMYTSGSTGTPKGLMHTHSSGMSYARLSAKTYNVSPNDRLGNHSPLHFDMSTFDYLTGPMCGSTTIIVPEEVTFFPGSLASLMEIERLTFWYSVPLALIQLLAHGDLQHRDISSLRWVMFGGEPFPPKHLRRLMELWPHARFSNVYGPAEVNQCTYYHLPGPPEDLEKTIPLGEIWDETLGLVVDEQDQPVVSGTVGELLIHSPTMMRGYWNRADLNAEAFVELTDNKGEPCIYYRTGDLVYRNKDGELVFAGRKDRQIKIRGYRIELDEIEAVLASHPAVQETGVVASNASDGNRIILAAVTLEDQELTEPEQQLLRHASDHLPPYAVPSRLEIRNSFPRTTSGKIDKRMLAMELTTTTTAPTGIGNTA